MCEWMIAIGMSGCITERVKRLKALMIGPYPRIDA
jgi:hypothetical protein